MRIYADITELAQNPVRSGIQRVVRELLREWPGPDELVGCVFESERDELVTLPWEAVDLLCEPTPAHRALNVDTIRISVQAARAREPGEPIPRSGVRVFAPEVFFDPARCAHYQSRLAVEPHNVFLLFYDFIPWLYPELIGVRLAAPLMPYLLLAANTRNAAFISAQTRSDWQTRVLRDPNRSGRVLPLGADGIEIEPQAFRPDRRGFLCLGSVDGRKNQHIVARAFASLWKDGFDQDLHIVGYSFDPNSAIMREINDIAAAFPQLHYVPRATDAEVADIIFRVRATIYLSEIEGFGLPPVESLHAGVPVITTFNMPSLADVPPRGHVRLPSADAAKLTAALIPFADDTYVEKLWSAASQLELPTWRDFAREAADWLKA